MKEVRLQQVERSLNSSHDVEPCCAWARKLRLRTDRLLAYRLDSRLNQSEYQIKLIEESIEAQAANLLRLQL